MLYDDMTLVARQDPRSPGTFRLVGYFPAAHQADDDDFDDPAGLPEKPRRPGDPSAADIAAMTATFRAKRLAARVASRVTSFRRDDELGGREARVWMGDGRRDGEGV
jgi:hypothetical protein